MFKKNLDEISDKISLAAQKSGRNSDQVRLLAVTKKVAAERVREAYDFGLRDFAENYVQEAIIKQSALSDLNMNWHFIGNIQTNKIKVLAQRFALIHSVDRQKVIEEISQRTTDSVQDFLLEINLAQEEAKGGCAAHEVPDLLDKIQSLPHIRLRGFMFMPPIDYSEDQLRDYFSRARDFRNQMQSKVSLPHSLVELSMGTSHDFEIAIQEGATIVRLGTALFGRRI